MTWIERTAYPRLPGAVSLKELRESFTPSDDEMAWAAALLGHDQVLFSEDALASGLVLWRDLLLLQSTIGVATAVRVDSAVNLRVLKQGEPATPAGPPCFFRPSRQMIISPPQPTP